eukprot:SAG11_NODE_39106_length_241_cov_2.591549_1_plen_47_part_10
MLNLVSVDTKFDIFIVAGPWREASRDVNVISYQIHVPVPVTRWIRST